MAKPSLTDQQRAEDALMFGQKVYQRKVKNFFALKTLANDEDHNLARKIQKAKLAKSLKERQAAEAAEWLARAVPPPEPAAPKPTRWGSGAVSSRRPPQEESTIRPLTPYEKMTGRRERQVVHE